MFNKLFTHSLLLIYYFLENSIMQRNIDSSRSSTLVEPNAMIQPGTIIYSKTRVLQTIAMLCMVDWPIRLK